MASGLHQFIDEIQIDLAELHREIAQNWFEFSQPQAVAPGTAQAAGAVTTTTASPAAS